MSDLASFAMWFAVVALAAVAIVQWDRLGCWLWSK